MCAHPKQIVSLAVRRVLMMDSPSEVDEAQLKEFGIAVED